MPLAIKSYVAVYSSFFLTGLPTNPLVWICAVPFYTALALLFLPNSEYVWIRRIIFTTAAGNCVYIQELFNNVAFGHTACPKVQLPVVVSHEVTEMYTSKEDVAMNLVFSLGIDGISLFFIVLTIIIFPFCFLSIYKKTKDLKVYCCCLLVLEGFLLLAFSVGDLFFFYVFFEASLIPMFFIIGLWGSGYERIKAAYFFFFFTLAGSIFFLMAVFVIYAVTGSTLFCIILNSTYLDWKIEFFLFFALGLGFAVKIPVFPLHTWLPEAHVQSPTEGSVILASLMLKLGGYGCLRVLVPITWKAMIFFYPVVAVMTICGVVFCSMSAVVQLDLKKLIAYSSVAHMNLVLLGIFSLNLQGIQGSLFLMIAHGLVSSGLFFLVGFLYDRHHTRVITYYSGLSQTMPIFSTVLFLFFLANISFPLTANFVGEILILIGVIQNSFFSAFFVATGTILSAIYSFFSFGRLAFLGVSPHIEVYEEISSIEFLTVWYFIFLILVLGIKPNLVLDLTDYAVSYLLIEVEKQ